MLTIRLAFEVDVTVPVIATAGICLFGVACHYVGSACQPDRYGDHRTQMQPRNFSFEPCEDKICQ